MQLLDFLNLQDSLTVNKVMLVDVLSITDSISTNVTLNSILESLSLVDSLEMTRNSVQILSDTLVLTDRMVREVHFVDFTDHLFIYDLLSKVPTLQEKLTISDSLVAAKALGFRDNLGLVDSLSFETTRLLSLFDILVVQDRVFAQASLPLPAPSTEITFTDLSGQTLVLDNPKFANTNTIEFKRINRNSRGNDLILKGFSTWEPKFLQRYEWDYIQPLLLKSAMDFVVRNVGLPVTIEGLYAEVKTVLLIKPDVEFSQIGRENHTFILDMQETQ